MYIVGFCRHPKKLMASHCLTDTSFQGKLRYHFLKHYLANPDIAEPSYLIPIPRRSSELSDFRPHQFQMTSTSIPPRNLFFSFIFYFKLRLHMQLSISQELPRLNTTIL